MDNWLDILWELWQEGKLTMDDYFNLANSLFGEGLKC